MIDPNSFDECSDLLRPEHFYSGIHQRIASAIMALRAAGKPCDTIVVGSLLKDRKQLESVGGLSYLTEIINSIPHIHNVRTYAQRVVDTWRTRQVIATCQAIAAKGYGAIESSQAFADEAAQNLWAISQHGTADTLERIGAPMDRALGALQTALQGGVGTMGTPSGFDALDGLLGGFFAGDLTVVAARPGKGKSALALNMAVNVARQGLHAVFFSCEMPREQLAQRAACSEAAVEISSVRSAAIPPATWQHLKRMGSELGRLPLWIDDKPALTVLDMRAKVRRVQAAAQRDGQRVGLVVVDYLQLMRGTDLDRKQGRAHEVSELVQGLKNAAKDLKVPLVALSQLKRPPDEDPNAEPRMEQLRESGNIEQAADNIALLHEITPTTTRIILAKHRNGPTGSVDMQFDREFTKFREVA